MSISTPATVVPSRLAFALAFALTSPGALAEDIDTPCLPQTLITDTAASPTPPATAHAEAASSQCAPSWTMETILVKARRERYAVPDSGSATRTDTPLLEVPQSVQVLTRTLIQEQDRRTLGEALVNVSGVTPGKPEEGLFAAPIVRGFPAEIYQDGLPMYGSTEAANDPTSLVGIERIEVLKGPNSTLYGGGVGSPLGGLINIVSERPDDKFGGFVALRGGSFSTVDPYGELNVPLTSGIAARIAAEYQSNDSWIDKLRSKRWFVQPSISFQLDPQTDLLLQGQFSRRSQLEYSGLPAAQALAGELDRNAFPGATNGQPDTTTENRMVTATLRHAFSDDVRLTLTARHYDSRTPEYGSFVYSDYYPADPATPTVYPILALNMLTKVKETTFDANVSAESDFLGGHHTFLAGVDYDHTGFSSDMGFAGVPIGSLDLADPVYSLSFGALAPLSITQTDRYQTIAAYVQDQATYGRLHLTGSLRDTQLQYREVEEATDQTYHKLSPRIGATFDLVPGVAWYAGYASAFRGAFAFVGLQSPKPETSSNVETGLKFALPDAALSGTLAAFEQKRDNVATADPDNLLYSIQSGEERARGIEADLIWEPSPALSVLVNYAYTHAKVTEDNTIPVGDTLPRVPKHDGRIAARYRVLDGVAKGLSFGAGITAFSARQLTLPNTVSVPGYAAVDAQASYDFARYTIAISAVNLTNRKAFDTYEYLSIPVVMPSQPRSAYITLKMRF